jgi:hypothetical protein
VWKQQLQEQLCDGLGLTVTVCHDPTGCSKWNPVEHRLCGPISMNWAGPPLRTWETLVGYLRGSRSGSSGCRSRTNGPQAAMIASGGCPAKRGPHRIDEGGVGFGTVLRETRSFDDEEAAFCGKRPGGRDEA